MWNELRNENRLGESCVKTVTRVEEETRMEWCLKVAMQELINGE